MTANFIALDSSGACPHTQKNDAVEDNRLYTGAKRAELTSNGVAGRPLLFVIIVYHEARMNDPGNPTEQGQHDAEKKACQPSRHQDRNRRKHDAEEISQRFHFFFPFFAFGSWALGVER